MQKSGISYKSYHTAVRFYDLKENAEAFLVTHKIKGAGGVSIWTIMEIGFIVFFERGEWDLPTAFYLIKKYWS